MAAQAGTLNRNFQGYTTTNTGGVIGVGLSTISDLPRGYYQNQRTLSAYQRAAASGVLPTERGVVRSAEDFVRGEIVRRLMCRFRLDVEAIERHYGLQFGVAFERELSDLIDLARQGLLRLTPTAIELTPLGAAFVRNIAGSSTFTDGETAQLSPVLPYGLRAPVRPGSIRAILAELDFGARTRCAV